VSIEGGGVVVGGRAVAHLLVHDGPATRAVLREAGIDVAACREVLTQRLGQDEPGQLGRIAWLMAQAGVNIEVMYSDHDHRLVLVVVVPWRAPRWPRPGPPPVFEPGRTGSDHLENASAHERR
jgi:hypothetical protein